MTSFFPMDKGSEKKIVFTKQGFSRLKKEYERLVTKERLRIAAKLNEANDFGDLRENAAWLAATQEAGLLELRTGQIKEMLDNAVIVDKLFKEPQVIDIGNTVALEDEIGNKQKFSIVPTSEINIQDKKFGIESPLVKAVLGRKVNDIVSCELLFKVRNFKIVEVN